VAHLDSAVTRPRRAAVIGGGWAGCAAAAMLAAAGVEVALYEASNDLGGRARRVVLELDGARHALDNGQHLMIGAYTSTARLLRAVDVALSEVVERRPFELTYPDGFALRAVRAPAPLHLLGALILARGLSLADRVALAQLLRTLKAADWRIGADCGAADWLSSRGQSAQLVRRVWRPLAIAALNTPLAEASAQIFANVLRDSLGASVAACELWLPRADLSALLPEAVERHLVACGSTVRRGARVTSVARAGTGFALTADGASIDVDAVVYAAPPAQLGAIAAPLGAVLEGAAAAAAVLTYQPICTVYLKYSPHVALSRGFVALLDDPSAHAYGQWAFDRGAFDAANRGIVAVVISADGPHRELTLDALEAAVARQLARELRFPAPLAMRTIVEKRATLKAAPGLVRPVNATAIPGFALAGDWTASDYPSTLESAVRSGEAAASAVLDD
jgi:hydroxysqualene dehydroxylase